VLNHYVRFLCSRRSDFPFLSDLTIQECSIGLLIQNKFTEKTLFYAPALSHVNKEIFQAMQTADIILVDGTFWKNDEMKQVCPNSVTALEMGHIPLSGENGLMQILRNLKDKRKILIHINNTNPVLKEDSPEAQQIKQDGIELAFDGMEITI